MQVYCVNTIGYFIGVTTADPDQLEPGRWLIPAGAVIDEPPSFGEGFCARWDFTEKAWHIEALPEPESKLRAAFNGLLRWVGAK